MTETIPEFETISELGIEFLDDGTVRLSNTDWTGNDCHSRIDLHPCQLRYLAERTGLVATSDPQAAKTIAKLTRRLLVLRDRIDHLADYLANNSDSNHADLTYEQSYATATADIADEFCADMDLQSTAIKTAQAPTNAELATSKQESLI